MVTSLGYKLSSLNLEELWPPPQIVSLAAVNCSFSDTSLSLELGSWFLRATFALRSHPNLVHLQCLRMEEVKTNSEPGSTQSLLISE